MSTSLLFSLFSPELILRLTDLSRNVLVVSEHNGCYTDYNDTYRIQVVEVFPIPFLPVFLSDMQPEQYMLPSARTTYFLGSRDISSPPYIIPVRWQFL